MKNIVTLLFLLVISPSLAQQRETFDLASYNVPAGWQQTKKTKDVVSYVITNKAKGTYGQIGIFASTISKGNITADFESEWQELVVKIYKPNQRPELTPKKNDDGWEVQAGAAPFNFNGGQSIVMLATISGYQRCMSLVMVTNTDAYQSDVTSLMESVVLQKPVLTNNETVSPVNDNPNSAIPVTTNFSFNTTNFDNGWMSTVHEDWVQVQKDNIKVLIHYPIKQVVDYNISAEDELKNRWNKLVAPRYSSGSNFYFKVVTGWQPLEFGEADLVEKGTAHSVHVVLYTKHHSNGARQYIEIVTIDKRNFETEFGTFDPNESNWEKLENMVTYNKFAVAVTDLTGKWTSNFSATQQYVNAYTGASAGMDSHASTESFEFIKGGTYTWSIAVASGMVGNIKFQNSKANGKFSMANNWQMSFSDIEGKPKTYDAHFTCVKGDRILWLGDTAYGKVQ